MPNEVVVGRKINEGGLFSCDVKSLECSMFYNRPDWTGQLKPSYISLFSIFPPHFYSTITHLAYELVCEETA
jgi:hypothetical protein